MTKCLYVGNVPKGGDPNLTQARLRELFDGNSREVVSIELPVDRKSGKVRGFAFVTLASEDSALEAQAEVHGTSLEGSTLAVSRAFRDERQGYEPPPPPHQRQWNPTPPVKKRRRR